MTALTSTYPPRLDRCNRKELLHYFQNTWKLQDLLMNSVVGDDTFSLNPDPLRNRLIFYLGHPAVFYINKLIRVGLLETRIDPEYEILFEVGVDPETPEELEAEVRDLRWPPVEAVWQYRDRARDCLTQVIEKTPLDLPIHPNHPVWALLMGIEHDRIHFETSSMLIRQLPTQRVRRPEHWHYAPHSDTWGDNNWVELSGGWVELGKPMAESIYGWDSEYGCRNVEVKPFFASQSLISNGEFWAFVRDGGYTDRRFWEDDAWHWKERSNTQHPKFWIPQNGTYRYRATFDEIDLPLDWAVEVNGYEAIAFCRWKGEGTRLMTEAEWTWAVRDDRQPKPNGDVLKTEGYNLNLKYGSPSPVAGLDTAKSPDGLYDLRGNVWEWIGDKFHPLPGFSPHFLYEDQSAPFFDDRHLMLLGGSWATNGTMASASYRNWFRPYFYQHAGFRIARDGDA